MDPGHYCRQVESYLCRQNGGHLVRIVGPAFELVCGWAERQIPLRVVFGAIDRTVARHRATRHSRRPLRIAFCEADVLELFEEWRRAVGVGTAAAAGAAPTPGAARRPSLAAHLERIADRLTTWQAGGPQPPEVTALVSQSVDELRALQARARSARGVARREIVARLSEMERDLTAILHQVADPQVYAALCAAARTDLAPFCERMPREALARATRAATDRLLYDHFKLPRITFE